jgi:heme exporter protein B
MLGILKGLFYYELCGLVRKHALWLQPILFFIVMLSLFGIGLGLEETYLVAVSPAIIWIVFLLTSLLTVEALLRKDHEEGALEQLVLSDYPLWWLVMAKSWAVWMVSALPLVLLTPLVGMMMHLSLYQTMMLMLTLLLGSPGLSFIGVLGAALTVSLPRAGLLLGLLLLPLYLPILIVGESAFLSLSVAVEWPVFQIALLLAFSILSITLAPHAASAALKASMDES